MRCLRWMSLAALLGCGPAPTSEAQLPAPSSRDVWVLVVHGSGDGPERWAAGLVESLRARLAQPERVELLAYDWHDAAFDKLAASGNGQQEGRAIAEVIAQRGLTHVHVIAHSAGAHVAFGLEEGLAGRDGRPTLHETLLDPFLGLGLDFNWGEGRFGRNADFAEQYLNVGDGVPSTDVKVKGAHVFDVSARRPSEFAGKEGHWWPTRAYAEVEPGLGLSLETAGGFDAEALRARWPPGDLTAL